MALGNVEIAPPIPPMFQALTKPPKPNEKQKIKQGKRVNLNRNQLNLTN